MRNFARINNYWNRLASQKEWDHLAGVARWAGHPELAEKYQPKDAAGWRAIDKAIAALRADLSAALRLESINDTTQTDNVL